ncbi:MAG: hypothetical protein QOG08_1935 [Chloroflexota bacterium]|nr:hypothetical protein [Chloroflexota bacterium]
MKRLLSGGRAALVVKTVTGFAVAAFAVVAAAAVTEAAITGSADPANWGQQVRQQVIACKAALQTGEHGIGLCVSAFAKQHGATVSDQRASGARLNHGNRNANGHDKAAKGNGNGKANGHGHGQTSHKPDHAVAVSNGAGD